MTNLAHGFVSSLLWLARLSVIIIAKAELKLLQGKGLSCVM